MSWDGNVQNGWLDHWSDANNPAFMNNQATNTTIDQLDNEDDPVSAKRTAILHSGSKVGAGPYTIGQRSLRADLTSAASVDDFRIWSPGAIVAALTGITTNPLPIYNVQPNYFGFYARCTLRNNIRVRIVFRTSANAVVGSVQAPTRRGEDGLTVDSGTIETIDWRMGQFWRRFSVSFIVPDFLGTDKVDHIVWQISNGTAGAQIIDIAGIECNALPTFRAQVG